MRLDLKKVLEEAEGFEEGQKICPIMSRYDVSQGAMQRDPDLLSFTVMCVGEKCGMFRNCNPIFVMKASEDKS